MINKIKPQKKVVPYIGTWIETAGAIICIAGSQVVPYIGTWIETRQIYLSVVPLVSYLI